MVHESRKKKALIFLIVLIVLHPLEVKAEGANHLVLGMKAEYDPVRLVIDMRLVLEQVEAQIEKSTGRNATIELALYNTDEELTRDIQNKYLDLAVLNAYDSMKYLNSPLPLVPLVLEQGKIIHLVVLDESEIKTVGEVQNHSLLFGDKDTLLGETAPQWILMKEGILSENIGSYDFEPDSKKAAKEVLMGQVDGAFIDDETYKKCLETKCGLRELAHQEPTHHIWFISTLKIDQKKQLELSNVILKNEKFEFPSSFEMTQVERQVNYRWLFTERGSHVQ